MNKKLRFLILGTSSALLMLGAVAGATAQEVTLRLGHIFADTHPIGIGATALSDYVAKESGGRMRVAVFPASQLGGLRALEDAAASGLLDITQSSAPSLQAIYEPAAVLTIPYAFRDAAHLQAAWSGSIGQKMRDDLVTQNELRVLSTFPQPPRHISANDPIANVDDLKGTRIRVPQVPSWVAFFEKIGAVPTPIELGELVTSLQLGIVTAQENPYATIESMKLSDVQTYLVPTGHVRTLDFFLLSNATYQKLPEDLRKIVMDGGVVAEKAVIAEWEKASESALARLQDAGMKLVDVDVQSIMDASGDLYKEFLTSENQKVFEDIQKIQ